MRTIIFFALLIGLLFGSCVEKHTTDAEEAFEYWAGRKADKNLKVINGQYSESAHWSKEYILFLELKPERTWREAFIKKNEFSTIRNYDLPTNAPVWFKPKGEKVVIWQSKSGAVCWEETDTERLFLFEYE